jgi:hypothetical protein
VGTKDGLGDGMRPELCGKKNSTFSTTTALIPPAFAAKLQNSKPFGALLAGFGVEKWRKCGIFQCRGHLWTHRGTVTHKYIVGTRHRPIVKVSPDVNPVVKLHAQTKGLTIAEATCVLLCKAILDIEGIRYPSPSLPQPGCGQQ